MALLKIPHFRGVFMRNKLPKKIKTNESGIINLDDYNGDGSHWTAYVKKGKTIVFFDSYGNLKPSKEVVKYFKSSKNTRIKYNYDAYQTYNSYNCGQLCLKFLFNMYY